MIFEPQKDSNAEVENLKTAAPRKVENDVKEIKSESIEVKDNTTEEGVDGGDVDDEKKQEVVTQK